MSDPCAPGACGTCPLNGGCGEEMRTPAEWGALLGIQIIDPDGWRVADSPDYTAPISEREYRWRMAMSTVQFSLNERPFADPNEPQGSCCGGGCN